MRIGHYQCACVPGDIAANTATVLRGLAEAAEAGLSLVSFPEAFLTGYFRDGAEARRHSMTVDGEAMRGFLRVTAAASPMFVVGFNERRGGALYNTVIVVARGRIVGQYSKAFPCFRYFTPGRSFPVFRCGDLVFGVIICADGGYIEPARILALRGARLVLAPHFNDVPDPVEHYQMVRHDHSARAVENGIYFLRGNNVFPGHTVTAPSGERYHGYGDSYLLDPNGEIAAAAGLYSEYLMTYNLDLGRRFRAPYGRRSAQSARVLMESLAGALDAWGEEPM